MFRKVCKEHWESGYETLMPFFAQKNDVTRQWIEQYIPTVKKTDNKTCIEIGCYPGRYLSVFGELGYELYGVDYCKQLEMLPDSLKNAGYIVGQFWNYDLFELNIENRFDIVSSFGFIEHFENYIDVLERHISLVNDSGYIVIEVPNFIGWFQNWFHAKFDTSNFNRHYIPAMDIEKWVEILCKKNFQIIYKGYFGSFEFWFDNEKRNIFIRMFLKIFSEVSRVLLKNILPKNKKCYSPFGGVIARKK